ncbi:MAG: cyclic-di-AMP receptor [Clostridia bacterium]|nr:cyclic-di-AMP receptor [Clostridia bacterium]MDY2929021.1 cyclic-di-AMP receptor [Clostridiaceae bacterium]
MKMILGILNNDDAPLAIQHLTKDGFFVTKLSTSGGFLRAGNVTILVGVEDEKVQPVIDIIHQHAHSRMQLMPTVSEAGVAFFPTMPVEVRVGGATIFVLDVDRFEKF